MAVHPSFKHAWAAGIIDGEGSISIQKSKERFFNPRLVVVNTEVYMINELQHIFRCGSKRRMAAREGWKDRFEWGVYSREDLGRVLELTLPFLITKADKARLALEFLAIARERRRGQRSERQLEIVEEFYIMNQRGRAGVLDRRYAVNNGRPS